jgi:hypothetical protein
MKEHLLWFKIADELMFSPTIQLISGKDKISSKMESLPF